ncbi:hypothetical protein J008_05340 [Cryptococcus neoformans]|nr:hypothetical protein J008_05340 [Cryptococcus neoformans var. grubii]
MKRHHDTDNNVDITNPSCLVGGPPMSVEGLVC